MDKSIILGNNMEVKDEIEQATKTTHLVLQCLDTKRDIGSSPEVVRNEDNRRKPRNCSRLPLQPARASVRLQKQELYDTFMKSTGQPNCIRVGKTPLVELIDQSGEEWREEKSKLLFILSLGLSLKAEAPVIGPVIRLTPIDPKIVAQYEKRNKSESIIKFERELVAVKSAENDLRTELGNSTFTSERTSLTKSPTEIGILDIAVEDRDKATDKVFHKSKKLTCLKSIKKTASSITKPRIIIKFDLRKTNGWKHPPRSSRQLPRSGQSSLGRGSQPPLPSSNMVPKTEHVHGYIDPPPMKVNNMTVMSSALDTMINVIERRRN